MTDTTETKKTAIDQVKTYFKGVQDNPIQHALTLVAGAVIMRAVDTRVIRKELGDGVAASVRDKLLLGNVPLING